MEKLIVIVGPTAVGKTQLSIEAAKVLHGEVINGDALQVYKELTIGTAKVTPEEQEGIPHHLIDFLSPNESYSVATFQKDARKLIHQINHKGKIPLLVGGTGLYVNAVIRDYQFTKEPSNLEIRERLEQELEDYGHDYLHNKLQTIDPESAKTIHPHNSRRVIRALEIYELTGNRKSDMSNLQQIQDLYDVVLIGLTMDRDILYQRINQRVDKMIEKGLVQEARRLYDRGIRNTQAVQAIGYKELYYYFNGECTLEEAIELLKRNSRRFAKRQFTWFKNKMDINWFDMTHADFSLKANEIIEFIAGKL